MADITSTLDPTNIIFLNCVAVYVQNLMKKSQLPAFDWISHHTPWVNRFVSALLASASAAGLTFSHHDGIVTITGVTITGISAFFYAMVKNYFFQAVIYKATTNKVIPATAAAVIPVNPLPPLSGEKPVESLDPV
jgi:hypothetical protein